MDGIVAATMWLVEVVRSDGNKRTEIVAISGPGSNDLEEFHKQLLGAAKEQFGNDVVEVENIYYRIDDKATD